MKKIFAAILILLVSNLSAKAFHLVIVADTKVYDENKIENKISSSCTRSMQIFEQSFAYISSVSGIPLYTKKLTSSGGTFTYHDVKKWMRREKIKHDDIVIFVYEGHGTRWKKTLTIWPHSWFDDATIDFTHIIQRLLHKKAALTLVIMDCCNSFLDKTTPSMNEVDWSKSKAYFLLTGMNDRLVAAGCRELFSKPYGLILAAAAPPGKTACSREGSLNGPYDDGYGEVIGGLLSNIFLNNLFRELQAPSPRWRHVLKRTQTETAEERKLTGTQYSLPQYRIFQHKHRREPSDYVKELFRECAYHNKSLHAKDSTPLNVLLPCSCFSGTSIDEFDGE